MKSTCGDEKSYIVDAVVGVLFSGSPVDERRQQVVLVVVTVRISEVVADSDQDEDVEAVEEDLAQDLVHLDLLQSVLLGPLQDGRVGGFVDDRSRSRRA